MQMTGADFFLLWFWGTISWLILIIPATTLLRYLTPKWFLERYFCKPYFTNFETQLFSGIPYYIARTMILCSGINFPSRIQKGRGIKNIRKGLPNWFIWANRIYMLWLFGHGGGTMLILIGFTLSRWVFPSL